MMRQWIHALLDKNDLTKEECKEAVTTLITSANSSQAAAFLALLSAKGETVDELHGAFLALSEQMIPISIEYKVLDIVGTGGDGANSLNISTASAILAASCGVKIAKHGNRSVSSLAGSADVLEALGISIHATPEQIERQIAEMDIGFLFAPDYHPALKTLKPLRNDLKIRTLFNLVAPLLNPTGAEYLLLGVSDPKLLERYANLLMRLPIQHALIFHGAGLDELSCAGPIDVVEVAFGEKNAFILDATHFGLKRCTIEDLQGHDAAYNARKILEVFDGRQNAFADSLIFNAGVAISIYDSVSIQEGINLAKKSLQGKKALALLEKWRAYV